MSEEWGPWIEHDGRGCPPEIVGCFAHVWFEAEGDHLPREMFDIITPLLASCPSWEAARYAGRGFSCHWGDFSLDHMCFVTRYRIRKPRALEQLREIARNPERELEDA